MSRCKKALIRKNAVSNIDNTKIERFELSPKKSKTNEKEEITFWQLLQRIYLVFKDEADTHGNMTMGVFASLISISFRIVALAGLMIFFVGVISLIAFAFGLDWNTVANVAKNIYVLVLSSMLLFILFLYSVIMWGASNEMKNEQDKNYIVSVFSGIVSFAALIVALIALFRGGT